MSGAQPRHYPWPLPHQVTGLAGSAVAYGVAHLPEVAAALPRLRPALVAKLQSCGFWSSVTFTKEDLDSVPDDLWVRVAPYLK